MTNSWNLCDMSHLPLLSIFRYVLVSLMINRLFLSSLASYSTQPSPFIIVGGVHRGDLSLSLLVF
jgi:hypothetical protein